ncbi:MAG: hypothetical protein ACOVOR_02445 [Rhabdochlamydiaceae bacterium]
MKNFVIYGLVTSFLFCSGANGSYGGNFQNNTIISGNEDSSPFLESQDQDIERINMEKEVAKLDPLYRPKNQYKSNLILAGLATIVTVVAIVLVSKKDRSSQMGRDT